LSRQISSTAPRETFPQNVAFISHDTERLIRTSAADQRDGEFSIDLKVRVELVDPPIQPFAEHNVLDVSGSGIPAQPGNTAVRNRAVRMFPASLWICETQSRHRSVPRSAIASAKPRLD
jgi:hypothetical protein